MNEIESIACEKNQATLSGKAQALLYAIGMTMGKRIKRARERLSPKVSQAKLGTALGVTGPAVSEWERDLSQPEARRLPALADALKVPVRWLLAGNGVPPEPDSVEAAVERLYGPQRAELARYLRMMAEEEPAAAKTHPRAS